MYIEHFSDNERQAYNDLIDLVCVDTKSLKININRVLNDLSKLKEIVDPLDLDNYEDEERNAFLAITELNESAMMVYEHIKALHLLATKKLEYTEKEDENDE